MSAKIYNLSMIVGLSLISAGVGMVSIPAALITAGGLIIALTLTAASFSGRKA